VDANYQGKGIGKTLLKHLVSKSEKEGFYTLQAGIFSENKASIKLHEDCGFRVLGFREKIAQRNGKWYDNVLMERRSKKINYMKNVLVLCTGNSCRSQMAQGYLEKFSEGKATIYSAGIETHGLNPGAVKSMADDGIDISHHTSNHVDEYAQVDFDFIITVCDHANENCPFIPSKNALRLHHNFSDPSKVVGSQEDISEAFIKTREEIKGYCAQFVTDNF
jgi:arsenate reductase